jgi:hypothetical protein
MADVILQFDTVLVGPNDRSYVPRACGRVVGDARRWEGWIEFVPADDNPVLRTSRETTQPNREDLAYWATGLTDAYLEGALKRALEPPPAVPVATALARPAYDEPAPPAVHVPSSSVPHAQPQAIMDPFHVYAQGEDLLRRELSALGASHLRNIIRAYELVDETTLDLGQMNRASLADLIVAAVRKRTE